MRSAFVFILVFVCVASSAQIGAKVQQANKITGIWQNNQFGYQMTLMLNADGSGEFDGEAIKYVAKGNQFTMTIVNDRETINYNYSLQGNTLTISGGDLDQPVAFARAGSDGQSQQQNDAASQQTAAPTNSGAASGQDKNLLGVWSGNGESIEFKNNGQCIYLGNTLTYQANQGHVTLGTNQGNVMFSYNIQGDKLTLAANGNQVIYNRGQAAGAAPTNTGGKGTVAMELVGKWCWVNTNTYNNGGSSSSQCIVLNGDGTYEYTSESSRSVNADTFYGGTNAQGSDRGTWYVQGDRMFYNSQTKGQGSYRLEKRNHPKNVNDPMIVLDGEPFVTQYQKAPWR